MCINFFININFHNNLPSRHGLLQLPDFMSGVKIAVHVLYGVTGGTRIHDNQSHNLVFYQLNYGHMEQVMGIEPTSVEWQSTVLAVVLHLHLVSL